ncbi:MAG: hypothetical protein J6B21_04165 [Oscillospiraceae bacterium]|nr:hypothetical protein [Oscillospiraceae bacterium]
MATQIAPTPTLKGAEAVRVWQEAHKKPTEKSKLGAKILVQQFEKMVK